MGATDIDLRRALQRRQQHGHTIAIIATPQDKGVQAAHRTIDNDHLVARRKGRLDCDDVKRLARPASRFIENFRLLTGEEGIPAGLEAHGPHRK